MKKIIFIISASILALSMQAQSAEYLLDGNTGSSSDTYLKQGTQAIGIQSNLDLDSVGASYGYFVKDNWEVGGEVGLTSSDNISQYSLGAFTEYNFTNKTKWVPYVGIAGKYAYYDEKGGDFEKTLTLNLRLVLNISSNLK